MLRRSANVSDDILLLQREFMQRFSRRHGIKIKGITDEARHMLVKHSWPGNVRELQNVIERAVILCGDNGMLEPEAFWPDYTRLHTQAGGFARVSSSPNVSEVSPAAGYDGWSRSRGT